MNMQSQTFAEAQAEKTPAPTGLAGWIASAASRLRSAGARRPSQRQLKLVERLAIGPKKELLLVRCGESLFLVGTGSGGVQTIVPVPVSAGPQELAL